jgi:hypothetical protein
MSFERGRRSGEAEEGSQGGEQQFSLFSSGTGEKRGALRNPELHNGEHRTLLFESNLLGETEHTKEPEGRG